MAGDFPCPLHPTGRMSPRTPCTHAPGDSRPSPGTPADGVALGRYFVIWFVIQRAW